MEITCKIIDVASDHWDYGEEAKKLQGLFEIEINHLFTVVLIPDLPFSQSVWDDLISNKISDFASPDEAKMAYAQSSRYVIASSPTSSYMLKPFEIEYAGESDFLGQTFEEAFGQKTLEGCIQWVPQDVMERCLLELETLFDVSVERDPEKWPIETADYEVLRLIVSTFVEPGYATVPPVFSHK